MEGKVVYSRNIIIPCSETILNSRLNSPTLYHLHSYINLEKKLRNKRHECGNKCTAEKLLWECVDAERNQRRNLFHWIGAVILWEEVEQDWKKMKRLGIRQWEWERSNLWCNSKDEYRTQTTPFHLVINEK